MPMIDISLFLISAGCLFLSILIYLSQKRSLTNISFSIFILNGTLWAVSIAMFRLSNTLESALFWDRLIYICGILVSPLFLFFCYIFPEEKIKIPLFYKIIWLVPTVIFAFVLLFSSFWIERVILVPDNNSVVLGPAYFAWVIWFSVYMTWACLLLFSKYQKVQGVGRIQFRYIFLGFLPVIIGGLPFNVILPLFGNYKLIWIGPLTLFLAIGFIALAILKHHLFEIKLILTEFLVGLIGLVASIQIFLAETIRIRILSSGILFLFCIIGYLLVRSTHREIRAKEILEQKVQERTKELEKAKNIAEERAMEVEKRKEELEKFYNLTVGRELKMIELKEKIKELEGKSEEE